MPRAPCGHVFLPTAPHTAAHTDTNKPTEKGHLTTPIRSGRMCAVHARTQSERLTERSEKKTNAPKEEKRKTSHNCEPRPLRNAPSKIHEVRRALARGRTGSAPRVRNRAASHPPGLQMGLSNSNIQQGVYNASRNNTTTAHSSRLTSNNCHAGIRNCKLTPTNDLLSVRPHVRPTPLNLYNFLAVPPIVPGLSFFFLKLPKLGGNSG